MARPTGDRRVQRTRSALVRSFNELFLTEGYDGATPARIAEAADVGRSTFYEHFSGKEDLLRERLTAVLAPVADAVCAATIPPRLEFVLDHFWSNRAALRELLSGRAGTVAMRELSALVLQRLSSISQGPAPALPLPLAAAQVAGGQLALIEEWLCGRHACSAAALARGLYESSCAAAAISSGDLANRCCCVHASR